MPVWAKVLLSCAFVVAGIGCFLIANALRTWIIPRHPLALNWAGGFALSSGIFMAVWVWRTFRRRTTPGHCPACGYDRRGLDPAAACPECGRTA